MEIEGLEITKLYYSIGEVADMFNVNSSLIRFWEKEFSEIKPKKNKKGNRLFTKKDIENLSQIYQLVKVEGYTLEGAKIKLKGPKVEKESIEKVVSKLNQIKGELKSLRDHY